MPEVKRAKPQPQNKSPTRAISVPIQSHRQIANQTKTDMAIGGKRGPSFIQGHASDEPFEAWGRRQAEDHAARGVVLRRRLHGAVVRETRGHQPSEFTLLSSCYHPANTHRHAASTFDRSAR